MRGGVVVVYPVAARVIAGVIFSLAAMVGLPTSPVPMGVGARERMMP
jgi:hypothetical protein